MHVVVAMQVINSIPQQTHLNTENAHG